MTKDYMIVKRDGTKVLFDVTKIKKVIGWACVDIEEVNPIELESQAHIQVQDNMTTEQIQQTLINTALSMTRIEEGIENLNWRFVAARLTLLNLYKQAKRVQNYDNFGYNDYYSFVKMAVKEGIYEDTILKEYSIVEIQEMGKERNMKYDYLYDYSAINLFKNRYLMTKQGKTFELPQDMYLTISLLLALPETKDKRLKIAKDFYHALSSRKISSATPILLNLRRASGNLASCFITAMDDSLDSIYYTLDQLAQISKNAGGVGVNISRIRGKGSYIKKIKGASGGILPWIKLVNDTAIAVNQLGSRAGAITVAIDIWHIDVEDFLDMQTENGDPRKKVFDIFPQLVVPDEFIRRVEKGAEWTLVDPREIKQRYGVELCSLYGEEFEQIYSSIEKDEQLEFKKSVNAKELFKVFLKTLIETGMPYIFFKDTVNRVNPNKHKGYIGNANLCTESFSNFSPSTVYEKYLSKDSKSVVQKIDAGYIHTCNLVSLNLAQIDNDQDLKQMVRLSVRLLDNTIDITKFPVAEAAKHNSYYRILGIGSLGLADYLAKRKIVYKDSISLVDELYEKIAYYGVSASCELAAEKGKYPNFNGSQWSKGILFGKNIKWFRKNSKMGGQWEKLIKRIERVGLRNGGLFAIAPNTSTSLLMGCTASVLPVYKKFFIDKGAKGAVPVVPPFLNEETFWIYTEAQNMDQNDIIRVISTIQKWIDQGISMEIILNLKENLRAKDIYNYYINAWKLGCKTVYYARSITKTVENTKEDCLSCAN